jgi:hypothetical protein
MSGERYSGIEGDGRTDKHDHLLDTVILDIHQLSLNPLNERFHAGVAIFRANGHV